MIFCFTGMIHGDNTYAFHLTIGFSEDLRILAFGMYTASSPLPRSDMAIWSRLDGAKQLRPWKHLQACSSIQCFC